MIFSPNIEYYRNEKSVSDFHGRRSPKHQEKISFVGDGPSSVLHSMIVMHINFAPFGFPKEFVFAPSIHSIWKAVLLLCSSFIYISMSAACLMKRKMKCVFLFSLAFVFIKLQYFLCDAVAYKIYGCTYNVHNNTTIRVESRKKYWPWHHIAFFFHAMIPNKISEISNI